VRATYSIFSHLPSKYEDRVFHSKHRNVKFQSSKETTPFIADLLLCNPAILKSDIEILAITIFISNHGRRKVDIILSEVDIGKFHFSEIATASVLICFTDRRINSLFLLLWQLFNNLGSDYATRLQWFSSNGSIQGCRKYRV
jgi:hypothetical protein